jgi:hypothetical protein
LLDLFIIPAKVNHQWWWISRWTGSLLKSQFEPSFIISRDTPLKIQSALEIIKKPYKCCLPLESFHEIPLHKQALTERYYKNLASIGSGWFFPSVFYASMIDPIYDSTIEAMTAISSIDDERINRFDRCLQRTLTAVKTSKSFKRDGVLFIGALLESLEMHAWIIEEGSQPDLQDRNWINYRPLIAISHK